MQLTTLKKNANKAAKARNHSLDWTAPQHGEHRSNQTGICKHCGMEVYITTKPLYNQTDIAGEAVAMNCPFHKRKRFHTYAIEVTTNGDPGWIQNNDELNWADTSQESHFFADQLENTIRYITEVVDPTRGTTSTFRIVPHPLHSTERFIIADDVPEAEIDRAFPHGSCPVFNTNERGEQWFEAAVLDTNGFEMCKIIILDDPNIYYVPAAWREPHCNYCKRVMTKEERGDVPQEELFCDACADVSDTSRIDAIR